MKENAKNYYDKVGVYYDLDAPIFEQRYWKNPVLQRIRADFRIYVHKHDFKNVLEIGFGSGLDLKHFATNYPDKQFYGIDVSLGMVELGQQKKSQYGLSNVHVSQGSVEQLDEVFPNVKYDLVYVFFGALNTVDDLNEAARCLNSVLKPEGKLVLTFVNKWYLQGMLIELIKFRINGAIGRLKKVWGGYSPSRHLASICYSPMQIQQAFNQFNLVERQGYSILHPAWYYIRINRKIGAKARWILWRADKILNKTLAWKWGEYALYVFKKSK